MSKKVSFFLSIVISFSSVVSGMTLEDYLVSIGFTNEKASEYAGILNTATHANKEEIKYLISHLKMLNSEQYKINQLDAQKQFDSCHLKSNLTVDEIEKKRRAFYNWTYIKPAEGELKTMFLDEERITFSENDSFLLESSFRSGELKVELPANAQHQDIMTITFDQSSINQVVATTNEGYKVERIFCYLGNKLPFPPYWNPNQTNLFKSFRIEPKDYQTVYPTAVNKYNPDPSQILSVIQLQHLKKWAKAYHYIDDLAKLHLNKNIFFNLYYSTANVVPRGLILGDGVLETDFAEFAKNGNKVTRLIKLENNFHHANKEAFTCKRDSNIPHNKERKQVLVVQVFLNKNIKFTEEEKVNGCMKFSSEADAILKYKETDCNIFCKKNEDESTTYYAIETTLIYPTYVIEYTADKEI
jgi:hypothetical protein